MVVEDYPPFLISEIYLRDVGMLSYPHHRPLERVNWVFPFWADARGQDALLGLPLFWSPVDGPANGAYFQTPSIVIIKLSNMLVLSRFIVLLTWMLHHPVKFLSKLIICFYRIHC